MASKPNSNSNQIALPWKGRIPVSLTWESYLLIFYSLSSSQVHKANFPLLPLFVGSSDALVGANYVPSWRRVCCSVLFSGFLVHGGSRNQFSPFSSCSGIPPWFSQWCGHCFFWVLSACYSQKVSEILDIPYWCRWGLAWIFKAWTNNKIVWYLWQY